jgi:PEP-CTERM motif
MGRTILFFLVGLAGLVLTALPARALTPAQQAGLDLGMDNNYAFIDIGPTTLGWNSGPIAGSVLFGNGLTANLSGGNNGGLTNGGILYYDNTVTISGSLQNPVTEVQVGTSVTDAAANIAHSVSDYAASLSATQTFTNITGTATISGNGDLNVIDANSIQNANLTLSGSASDYFVFNISDMIQTNQPMTLSGVDPSHILFNLTGTGMVLFQTSGGNLLYGTYLAANGGRFQFSNLDLTGQLINIGGDVQFVSGSQIPVHTPFIVPEPASTTLLLIGVGALAVACWRRRVGLNRV